MIVDASAICAIVLGEAEGAAFGERLRAASERAVSAINLFESVLIARRYAAEPALRVLIEQAAIAVIPCDAALTERALAAHARYGKGNHRAKLNLGDCYAYALSKASGRPLLFKGRDFALTDVTPALTA